MENGCARPRGPGSARSRAKNRRVQEDGNAGWDRHGEVAGLPTFWREADPGPSETTAGSVLYLHGVPTSSDDFLPFLERAGGVAPDLPGFGRSGKPAAFDYSVAGYARFLESFVDSVGLDRFSLVVHDWGAVGLALSEQLRERIQRVVVMNAVPLLPGYRWHRVARLWRTPLLGEMTMGFTTRWGMRRAMREAVPERPAAADALTDAAWRHFDHGTQRAILKLYRSAPPDELARRGAALRSLTGRALVLWGERDPYIAPSFARAYAEALGGPARVEALPDAGHWPWLDRPEAIDLVADFLAQA